MAKDNNIVHQYFKKQHAEITILVKVNPIFFKGTEITVFSDGKTHLRELEFDENIEEDLKLDGFENASALEFNLYASGLV
ncbi:MAG: hypothetical protein C0490_06315 [Marivirga sp.]|nr:hypothetical protein [Marivirga sp.]